MTLSRRVGVTSTLLLLVVITAANSNNGCVRKCTGLNNGDYQSCRSCSVYVSCVNGRIIDGRPCSTGLVWDDNEKQCMYQSTTCIDATTPEIPDMTTPKSRYTTPEIPDYNNTTPEIPDYNNTTPEIPDYNNTTPEIPDYNNTTPEIPDYNNTTPKRPDYNYTTPAYTTPPAVDKFLEILVIGGKYSRSAYTLRINVDLNGQIEAGQMLSNRLPVYHYAGSATKGTMIVLAGGEQQQNGLITYSYTGTERHFDHHGLPESVKTRKHRPAVFILGAEIFVAGGSTYSMVSRNTVESADMADFIWRKSSVALPTDASNTASVVIQDRVYITGGFIWTFPYYKPTLKSLFTWAKGERKMKKLTKMRTARYNHCACSDGSNYIWVIGGVDYYKGVLRSTEVYNKWTDKWETRKSIPVAVHSHACVYNDGLIYVLGGAKDRNEYKRTNVIWIYDTRTDVWNMSPTHLIEPTSGHIATIVQPSI